MILRMVIVEGTFCGQTIALGSLSREAGAGLCFLIVPRKAAEAQGVMVLAEFEDQ